MQVVAIVLALSAGSVMLSHVKRFRILEQLARFRARLGIAPMAADHR